MMKPYKALMVAAALTLGTSLAMAQSAAPSTKQQQTESDLNKSVGDGSSGGKNVGAQEKAGTGAMNAAPHANTTGSAKSAPSNETAKVGIPKEGKGGDAVTTTGTGKMNEKKQ
jgi:hypothetical protein